MPPKKRKIGKADRAAMRKQRAGLPLVTAAATRRIAYYHKIKALHVVAGKFMASLSKAVLWAALKDALGKGTMSQFAAIRALADEGVAPSGRRMFQQPKATLEG